MSQAAAPPSTSRNWAQFSLKSLLLLMLLTAVFCTGWGIAYRKTVEMEQLARREAEMARMAEMMARDQAQQALMQAQLAQTNLAQAAKARAAPPADAVDEAKAIEAVLRAQSEAWNQGDVDRFMEHYWRSDQLTFSAGGQTTRGWEATLARYRQRYPTREKMGQLTFDGLEILPLGDNAALVLGRWQLEREGDDPGGNFSLVVQKIDDRWVIVHDHTSSAGKPSSD